NPRNEWPKRSGKPGRCPDPPGPARAFARRAEPLDLIYLKSNGIPKALGLWWVQGKALLLPGFMSRCFARGHRPAPRAIPTRETAGRVGHFAGWYEMVPANASTCLVEPEMMKIMSAMTLVSGPA